MDFDDNCLKLFSSFLVSLVMHNVDTMAMIYWGARYWDILPTVEKSININIQNPRGGV